MGNLCSKNKKDIERYSFENYIYQSGGVIPIQQFLLEHSVIDKEVIIDKNIHFPESRWEKNYIGKEQKLYMSHRKIWFKEGFAYTIIFRELEELKGCEFIWHINYYNRNLV